MQFTRVGRMSAFLTAILITGLPGTWGSRARSGLTPAALNQLSMTNAAPVAADLSEGPLHAASLREADLTGANLTETDLTRPMMPNGSRHPWVRRQAPAVPGRRSLTRDDEIGLLNSFRYLGEARVNLLPRQGMPSWDPTVHD